MGLGIDDEKRGGNRPVGGGVLAVPAEVRGGDEEIPRSTPPLPCPKGSSTEGGAEGGWGEGTEHVYYGPFRVEGGTSENAIEYVLDLVVK